MMQSRVGAVKSMCSKVHKYCMQQCMVQQWFALVDACVKPAQCMSYLCMVREALVTAPNGKHGEVLVSKAQFIAMLFLDSPATVVRAARGLSCMPAQCPGLPGNKCQLPN